MFDLAGKVAIITGAASGIGAETARVLAFLGADVALGWYPGDPHDVEAVRASVEAEGAHAIAEPIDVRQTEDLQRITQRAVEELGGAHIVVANAGIVRRSTLGTLDDEAWNAVVDVDLAGAWRAFRAAIPHMQDAGYGRLLATSSVAGTVASWPGNPHYAAAKGGLVGMVKSLAVEYGPDGITANAVAPGVVRTPQTMDPVNSLGPDGFDAVAQNIPARRVGEPSDIASIYGFLASPAAAFVTGQLIVADGGRSLAGLD